MAAEVSARKPTSVAFRTLGCKVNRVESDAIASELLGIGVALVPASEAEVVVVNTCTVTGEADAKARKAVRQALHAPHGPVVVVTGCLAAIDADALRALGERVVVEADKQQVARCVADLLAVVREQAAETALREPQARSRATGSFRTRAMLKIEDGCDNFCSYCIVPYARGVPRAVPLATVVADAAALTEAGVREIVLTGINIGRYRDGGADLAALVGAVAATGIERLRISSIEPPDLTARLLGVLSETSSVCEHLHVPLQSGSDAVLRAMGRAYDTHGFEARMHAARHAIPGLALTTDVIAGFPGETDADHAGTLTFVERLGFSRLHVFRFSARAGTPAAQMAQLAPEVRARRAAQLRAAGETLCARYRDGRLGQEGELLVERVRDGVATGTTRDYLRVDAPMTSATVGDLVRVRLIERRGDVLLGEVLQ